MHWEWRNGPYNLILLGTILKNDGHCVKLADLQRDLVHYHGDLDACLRNFKALIQDFSPNIVGFSFFSVHFLEVQRAVRIAREACREANLSPVFVAGGIHASIEPRNTLEKLGFDYCCVGEGEQVLRQLAKGDKPKSIAGLFARDQVEATKGGVVENLDDLPFPDWSLCDYSFYSHPTYARFKIRKTSTLDILMGRGCVYRCNFCAYGCLSRVRFYSAEYLVEQMESLCRDYGVTSCYFVDSTIGNNRKRLVELCELLLSRGTAKRITWLANMRVDQVNRELLTLMQEAGCRYLFYGFESGSQRILDRMNKRTTVEQNYEVARLHNALRFAYNASMVVNYPGEVEDDISRTIEFLRDVKPPSIGINWYVPLPGSSDYDRLKEAGELLAIGPEDWRLLGQVNDKKIYAAIPETLCRKLYASLLHLANAEIPNEVGNYWGYTQAVC